MDTPNPRSYERGDLIAEGKTKRISTVSGHPELVWIENKADITAFDDPKFTRQFASKAVHATTTACRVFELLRRAGIPVAYEKQLSATEFLAHACRMIPVEAVARRYAYGSYLKRLPHLDSSGDQPHRFHRLVTELFLKTTKGNLALSDGRVLVEGLDPARGEEDPLIRDPYAGEWTLFHAKKPTWEQDADLGRRVDRKIALLDRGTDEEARRTVEDMEEQLRKVYLVLEGAWAGLGHRLIDIKIEFGLDCAGKLRVADVIDNDSWRLRDQDWRELSKEAFRQGEALDAVEHKYGLVASLVENFRLPAQALVLWRGSDSDAFPTISESRHEFLEGMGNVVVRKITLSAHKSPVGALTQLDELLGSYPGGGAIVAKVGRSNGLGPLLAARSTWPVITVPATADAFPDDVWSSLRMPSGVPLMTAWPDGNAVDAALNILAGKNPVLYMAQQYAIEERDR